MSQLSIGDFTKSATATKDYPIDFGPYLQGSERLASVPSFSVSPGGLTIGSGAYEPTLDADGKGCVVWLAGGTAGVTYTITCHFTTDNVPPRIDDRTISVTIEGSAVAGDGNEEGQILSFDSIRNAFVPRRFWIIPSLSENPADAATNTANLQAALDRVANNGRGGTVYIPAGNYTYNTTLELKKTDSSQYAGVTIVGDSGTPDTIGSRLTYAGTSVGFRVRTGSRVLIDRLSLFNAADSTALALELLNSWRVTLNACEFRFWSNGVLWTNTAHGEMHDCTITKLFGTYGVKIATGTAGINSYNTVINPERSGVPVGESVNGYVIEKDCDTCGIYSGAVLLVNHGIWLQADASERPIVFRSSGVDVEHCFGKGYLIEGCDDFDLSSVFCSQGRDDGVYFDAAFKGHGRIRGASINGNAGAGVYVGASPSHISMSDIHAGGNSATNVGGTANVRSGIEIAPDVGNVTIVGGKCGGDLFLDDAGTLEQRYGIETQTGAGAAIVINAVNCEGNVTGRIGWGAGGAGNKVRAIPNFADIG